MADVILNQADRDVAVSGLLSKVSEVCSFIMEEALKMILSTLPIYRKIAQHALGFFRFYHPLFRDNKCL